MLPLHGAERLELFCCHASRDESTYSSGVLTCRSGSKTTTRILRVVNIHLHGAVPQFLYVVGVDLAVVVEVQRGHDLVLDLGVIKLDVPHVAQ